MERLCLWDLKFTEPLRMYCIYLQADRQRAVSVRTIAEGEGILQRQNLHRRQEVLPYQVQYNNMFIQYFCDKKELNIKTVNMVC
jgi:hypothetical protein